MRKLLSLIVGILSAIDLAQADLQTPANLPVEINATGGTNYENGIATARDNVAIHVGDTDIYADRARYNSATHEVEVEGNVRIYRGAHLYVGEGGIYNIDTKQIRATNMRADYSPYFVSGQEISVLSDNETIVKNGIFTTEDAADPSFHLRANTVRIYEHDRVIFQNVALYIGKVPVFWWPYLYQSLNDAFSFSISPAYLSSWGPSLLSQITFPIVGGIQGRVRLDYRARRGEAIGFEADVNYGKDKDSYAKLKTYFLEDQNPQLNQTTLPRGTIGTSRYRLTFQDHTYFTDDLSALVNVTKLSDAFVLQDFYQTEFRLDPQPDNVVAATKSNPFYTLTGITRFQANSFFDTTERLPEVALDIKRHALFGGPIFYEGETSVADLHRSFASNSPFQDYSTLRADTFHQLLYPNTYFGWLSLVPARSHFSSAATKGWRDGAHGFKRRHGSFFQTLAHLGRRAKPHPRTRRFATHHSTFYEFFLCLGEWTRSCGDSPIRSFSAVHSTSADRLSAIYFHRFTRRLDDLARGCAQPTPDATRRPDRELDGTGDLHRCELR